MSGTAVTLTFDLETGENAETLRNILALGNMLGAIRSFRELMETNLETHYTGEEVLAAFNELFEDHCPYNVFHGT
jgi:hypothetical protein